MPTPLDVVPQHRRYAWPIFLLLSTGFIVLSVFLVLEGTKVKGFAVSWEPIPDYLPNVTVMLPVPARTTASTNPALDKLYNDTARIDNLSVGCGSYREYIRQLRAAVTRLGYEAYLEPHNLTIDEVFPDIVRELIDVVPGRQKPGLPQTGPRPLPADFLASSDEPYFTLLNDSICEATPRLLQPRDAWLNISSASFQVPAMEFSVSDALRSVEAAHSDHAIVWFVSLSYQAVASALGLQLDIKLFPDASKRRQNVVNLEIVEDGFSKYITLRPSIIRRLDGSEEIIIEATTENKANTLKTIVDEVNKGASLLPSGTTPAATGTGSASDVLPDLLDIISGIGDDNNTSESPDLASVVAGLSNRTGLGSNTGAGSNGTVQTDLLSTTNAALAAHPLTYAFMLFQLDPNGIQVTTEISLSTIEITSQIMAVASFFTLIFISLFTEQLSQRKMWLAPDELRPKLAAAGAVIMAVAASLRVRFTCFQPSSSGVTNQVASQPQVVVLPTSVAVP